MLLVLTFFWTLGNCTIVANVCFARLHVQEAFTQMSEAAKIEFLRPLLPPRVTEDMRELLRLRAEAEAVSSLDTGVF